MLKLLDLPDCAYTWVDDAPCYARPAFVVVGSDKTPRRACEAHVGAVLTEVTGPDQSATHGSRGELTTMNLITCVECQGQETFGVRPDGWFECPAGHELAPQDIQLDSPCIWMAASSGVLGNVVEASYSLEVIAEALNDLAESGNSPYAAKETFETAYGAYLDYVTAYRALSMYGGRC